jgi:hypothetical protein
MARDRDGPVRGLNAGSLRGRPLSLRSGVLGLVAGIVAAFLGFAALAVWQVQRAAEQEIAEQLRGTARAMALVVDREFSRAEALLQGLGRLPSLRAGDMPGFLANARVAAEGLSVRAVESEIQEIIRREEGSSDRRLHELHDGKRGLPFTPTELL